MAEQYVFTTDKPGYKNMILVSGALIAKTDAEINAALPTAKPGDVIHTSGYGTMKQKGLDGSWTAIE